MAENQHTGVQEDTPPRGKAELLQRIREAGARLDAFLDSLSPQQMTTPLSDGWSVKDHVAHLAAWRGMLAAILMGRPPWEGLGISQEVYRNSDEDQVNAIVFEEHHHLPLDEVLAHHHSMENSILVLLKDVPEDDLTMRYAPPWSEGKQTLLEVIVNNTYRHDLEHLGWMQRDLSQ